MRLLVLIPTYRHAATIRGVAESAAYALRRWFPSDESVILCVDGGSEDGTREAYCEAETGRVRRLFLAVEPGARGLREALRLSLATANELKPEFLVLLGGDALEPGLDTVRELVQPLQLGQDVAVSRHVPPPALGLAEDLVAYPLLHGLFGLPIRRPASPEMAFRDHAWRRPDDTTDLSPTGLLLGSTMSRLRICEVERGIRPACREDVPDVEGFLAALSPIIERIRLEPYRWFWTERRFNLPRFGSPPPRILHAPGKPLPNLTRRVSGEIGPRREMLEHILTPKVLAEVEELLRRPHPTLRADVWVRILFDALCYYCQHPSQSLLDALYPLFLARAADHALRTRGLEADVAEREVQALARRVRAERLTLVERFSSILFERRMSWSLGDARLESAQRHRFPGWPKVV